MKILHVLPEWPYPPHHGGRIDVYGRLTALSKLGHVIDLVVTARSEPRQADLGPIPRLARSVTIVPRLPNWRSLHILSPLQMSSRRLLREFKPAEQYDLALLEQEYVCEVLPSVKPHAKRVAIRIHNDEPAYYAGLAAAERSPVNKLYYLAESRLFRWTCPKLFSQADELWFISQDECREYEASRPASGARGHWLPAALNPECKPLTASSARVLFAGNLFQPSNLEALRWYLDEVHPRLAGEPGYEFWVAGAKRPDAGDAVITQLRRTVATRLHLNPPVLDDIYSDCAVFVNPMRQGGGVKIKTLDAIRHGLPVVSTQAGIAGSGLVPGRDVLVADDGETMAEEIRALLHSEARREGLHRSAAKFVRARYDHAPNLERLLRGQSPAEEVAIYAGR